VQRQARKNIADAIRKFRSTARDDQHLATISSASTAGSPTAATRRVYQPPNLDIPMMYGLCRDRAWARHPACGPQTPPLRSLPLPAVRRAAPTCTSAGILPAQQPPPLTSRRCHPDRSVAFSATRSGGIAAPSQLLHPTIRPPTRHSEPPFREIPLAFLRDLCAPTFAFSVV